MVRTTNQITLRKIKHCVTINRIEIEEASDFLSGIFITEETIMGLELWI